jgi:hypothetical protein
LKGIADVNRSNKWGGGISTIALTLLALALSAQAQIQTTFFGMGAVASSDLPPVPYGVLSHPPLAWTAIEGTGRGVYNFDSMDQFVNSVPKDANGVAEIDLALGWTPGWAVTNQKNCLTQQTGLVVCTSAPDNMQDWSDFVTQLANHYNGVTAPHVKYYEIWNEANTNSFWTGGITKLISMAKIAYPILKKDGFSEVLTPSVVWNAGTKFLTSYLSGGGSSYADGVSFHGYPSKTGKGIKLPVPLPESPVSTNAAIQTMIPAFRKVEDSNGMSGKPLVTTEGGWGVSGVSDADMQAAWITQYGILQAGLAAQNNLVFQTWYTWGHASSGTIETNQGLPNQAGLAYQEVVGWLVGTTPSPCTSSGTSGNLWSCPVGTSLIVWDASQTCSNGSCTTGAYNAPQGYVQYKDLTGAVHSINGTIALGVKPILMER